MNKRYAPILMVTMLLAAMSPAMAQSQPAAKAPAASAPAANETPQQNVKASQQYQQLTCTNKAFRENRIQKECGPLQGSDFYDSCVASFSCDKQPSDANWRKAPPSETTK